MTKSKSKYIKINHHKTAKGKFFSMNEVINYFLSDEMNSISYNPSYQNNMAYSIADYNANPYSNIYR